VPELRLGPLLRHVGETDATIWVETDKPCRVEILGHSAVGTTQREYPELAGASHRSGKTACRLR
jgi:hypothetical protein